MTNIRNLYVSIDGQPEFNPCDKISHLHYLGTESSPILTNNYQDSSQLDGNGFNFAQFGKNVINVHFKLHVHDRYDYEAKRHQIYSLFMQKRVFRLRFEEDANMVVFVRPVGFDINPFERAGHDCDIIIPFENPSGYKFSRYDSLNQVDLWDAFPLGFDLPVMDREDFHFQNDVRFDLLNPSGVPIDPYQENHDFKAMVTYTGDEFSIVNYTSGTTLTIKRASKGNEQFVINGCDVFLNGENVNIDTDFGNIKLETGFNDIHIIGSVDYDLQFEFPFIYV